LPLGEPARGEGVVRGHGGSVAASQSLLRDESLAVLVNQSLQEVSVGENSPAHCFHRRRKLGNMAKTLEGGPEQMDRRLVRLPAEPGGQSGEASKLPARDRPERHLLHTARKPRRNAQAREH